MRLNLKAQFNKDGYVVLEDFLSAQEIEKLKSAGKELTRDLENDKPKVVFSVENQTPESKKARDQYLLDSADQICPFYEKGAIGPNGELLADTEVSVNKVGHALHELDPIFRGITFSEKVKEVCFQLDLQEPVVAQSMYIYKNPRIGDEVSSHQDSTYLYTEPDSLVGFWFALDDATLENGCLWFIPSSHKGGVHCRLKRNPDQSSNEITIVDKPTPNYPLSSFVATPVKKGSCVLIHGQVVHRSESNKSTHSRHAYTFHVFDQATSKYSPDNWLQRDKFPALYKMN